MTEKHNPFLDQEVDIREYIRVLYDRRWIIISCTVILCTLSLIRSFMMKPIYQGSTKILIQKEAPRVLNIKDVAPSEAREREYYQTQYKILKSRSLAERVCTSLDGYVPWNEWRGRKTAKDAKPLPIEDQAAAILRKIEIKPVINTQLVEIKAEDVDPELAARIANLWASKYIAYVLDAKFDASQYASEWLQEKIKESRAKLEESERRLQEYRRENKIVVDDDEDKGTSVLNELLKKKAELSIELDEKLEYLKDKHPEIIGIRSELDAVDRKIASEKDIEIVSKDKKIQYNMLVREVDTNRKIYESLLDRISETEVTGELKTTNIRIVDKATVPKGPVKPRKKLTFLIALFLGVFGGGALAFLMEGLDQSIKNPDDLKHHLGLPALAAIAFPQEDDEKDVQIEFISFLRPRSTVSEAYKSLRTSIMFTSVEHKRKTLLLTSSGPQEGKTTNTINLAIVMAMTGEKTVLVDADLRQPRIEKAFNVQKENGLTEILVGEKKLDDVIHATEINNLDMIACGSIPPNPSELLGSGRMDEVLAELESRYDRVIIDTPPVLAVTDAVILSGKVDGTILVIKAGETNRGAVAKTKELLESVKTTDLIGAILNMVQVGSTGGYYYYQYYGKYAKDEHRKGKKDHRPIPSK